MMVNVIMNIIIEKKVCILKVNFRVKLNSR